MVTDYEPVAVALLFLAGMLILLRLEVRAGPSPGVANRNIRGLAYALLAFAAISPLTMALAFATSDKPLPVTPPGPPSACAGSSFSADGLLILAVIGVLASIRFGPALVGFLLARRRSRADRPAPSGKRIWIVATVLAGLSVVAVCVRLLMGGVQPDAFATYGALTPPGAKGFRVDTVIRRQLADDNAWSTLRWGADLESDTESDGHMHPGHHEVSGVKAWIGGQPVNITVGEDGRLLVQKVIHSSVDLARRPHFDSLPKVGRGPRDRMILVGTQSDGSLMAVRLDVFTPGKQVFLNGIDRLDVGLLLQPPLAPLLIGLGVAVLSLLLVWYARRLGRGEEKRSQNWSSVCRIGAACLLFEVAMFLYGSFRLYF